MSEKNLPDGIYLNGKVDSKFSPEPRQGKERRYNLLVNLSGYREKQQVSVAFADYEKIQVGDDFKCRCDFACFNNRIYWQPASSSV